MNDDSLGFETVDDALRRGLDAVAPRAGDPETALATLGPRFRRARRRHRIVVVGGPVLAALVFFAAGAVVLDAAGEGSHSVRVPAAGSVPAPDRTTQTTPAVLSSPDATGAPAAVPPSPTSTADDKRAVPSGDDSASAPTPTTTSPVVQRTYTSAGGSVTVKLAGGALSIASTSPVSGYSQELHDTGPTRVEVRFDNGKTQWVVRVDLVDGQMVERISQS